MINCRVRKRGLPLRLLSEMRLQSNIKVTVRGKVIGGPDLLLCVPLMAGSREKLLHQTGTLMPAKPDLFEWRVDGCGFAADTGEVLATLEKLRAAVGEIPVIFTCRMAEEGGRADIPRDTRLALIRAAMGSGCVDLVDTEMQNDAAFVGEVLEFAASHGVMVILSHHDFTRTPDTDRICETLLRAQEMGADIAKIAVMPEDQGDVLTLLGAALKARTRYLDIPLIAVSMGDAGRMSRVAGGLFGSDITVKTHINNIFNKLGVNDRTQAAVIATRHHMV